MKTDHDTLYYDGQCPMCSTEIRKLSRLSDGLLTVVDVHETDFDGEQKQSMLRVLHLQRADGTLLHGVDANIAAWEHTRFGFLFRWLRWPLIKPVVNAVYHAWANNRYKRLYQRHTSPGPYA